MVMGYLFKNSMQYLQDYRMALMKSMMSVSRAEVSVCVCVCLCVCVCVCVCVHTVRIRV